MDECNACHNALLEALRLNNCTCVFCASCIQKWRWFGGEQADCCPNCRAPYRSARRADGTVLFEGPAVDEHFDTEIRVAGVTFEGRQPRVRALVPGTPVVLVREPHNPYDPRAVAVHDVAGASLGYIPRELTAPFHNDRRPLEARVLRVGDQLADGRKVAWVVLHVQSH